MPTVTLISTPDGKLAGLTPKDDSSYQRFIGRIRNLANSCITFTWREPRSGAYHRRHFAMLAALFDAQEQFADDEQFRKWLEVGAGFCDFVPGPKGRMVALPKSIAYARLDQVEFEGVHAKVMSFIYSEHCRRFLWPHLDDQASWDMLESVLGEFA